MKYIINRRSYLLQEKIVWLDTKKESWDQDFSKLILSFHDRITEMIDELKDQFNDKDDPDEVKKVYLDYFEKAFVSLISEIRNVSNEDLLHKLWNEFTLNISLWKDSFRKMSEKLDNYNSIFKLGFEYFNRITIYITKSINNKYHEGLNGEIDDMRENSIKFIENFHKEIKSRLIDVDADDIFSMSNLEEKDIDDLTLNAGDEVRYYQQDKEENIAIISHNQEDLKEIDNIRLVSKSDGTQFEVDKSELIEIIPKHKTTNQEVGDKLKKVKSDPDKMDKLNNYLSKLSSDINEDLNNVNMNKRTIPLITDTQTSYWLSNKSFKKLHIERIGIILKNVYNPLGYWKKYQYWGVMDLPWEEERWSILNKINTNYRSLALLINGVNNAIVEGNKNIPLFDFKNVIFGSKEFYDEYVRFINFLTKNQRVIFLKLDENSGSKIINSIVNRIRRTTKLGDKAEELVIRRLYKVFKGDSVSNIRMISGSGKKQDMIGGVDISFKLNGDNKTIQVKKGHSILKTSSNDYIIIGVSISSHYNVDYISFVINNKIHLFEYDKNGIDLQENGDITIDKNLLINIV